MKLRIILVTVGLALGAAACGNPQVPPPGGHATEPTDTSVAPDPSDATEGPDTSGPTDPATPPSAEAKAMQDVARSVLVAWSVADLDGIFAYAEEGAASHKAELAPGTEYHDSLFGPGSWQMAAVQAWGRGALGDVRGDDARRGVAFYTFDDGAVALVDLYWGQGRWLFANLVRASAADFEAYGPKL